ncbi:TPA: RidA family protein [Pseudomonas putida]|uniref:RidA family protein n=1 Tax=Pseudomonas putida TaxID=303 RepID=UPI0023645D66|nr:RidA family protein [Pseudomonas putida]MDD2008351.1 RidA family protein [Pseudomonas putida]HDS1775817.1 RidA family protein [Pseudomonas putida]
MHSTLKQRLDALNIEYPDAPRPGANFVATQQVGNLLYVSGQVPVTSGIDRYVGKVGQDLALEDGQAAACLCALNILAQVDRALGGEFSRVRRCIRLGGFVNAAADFTQHPQVLNGASDLIIAVLGEAGRHARAAVGCNSLPRNVAVEVEAIFEIA